MHGTLPARFRARQVNTAAPTCTKGRRWQTGVRDCKRSRARHCPTFDTYDKVKDYTLNIVYLDAHETASDVSCECYRRRLAP